MIYAWYLPLAAPSLPPGSIKPLTSVALVPPSKPGARGGFLTCALPLGQKLVPLPEGSSYLGFIFAHLQAPIASLRASVRAPERTAIPL